LAIRPEAPTVGNSRHSHAHIIRGAMSDENSLTYPANHPPNQTQNVSSFLLTSSSLSLSLSLTPIPSPFSPSHLAYNILSHDNAVSNTPQTPPCSLFPSSPPNPCIPSPNTTETHRYGHVYSVDLGTYVGPTPSSFDEPQPSYPSLPSHPSLVPSPPNHPP